MHNVFYMNIQVKDFEVWMSQAFWENDFGNVVVVVFSRILLKQE